MLEQPLKNTKSPISTPKNYDGHPYHSKIGSTPQGFTDKLFIIRETSYVNPLTTNRPYAWWRFADQFHHHASLPCSFCTLFHISCWYSFQFLSSGSTFAFWMWGLVVKLIGETSSCIRPIKVQSRDNPDQMSFTTKLSKNKKICPRGEGTRRHSPILWVEVCRSSLKALTPFQTRKSNFLYPISGQT